MSLQVWLPLTEKTGINNQGLSDATFRSSGVTLTTTDGMGSCYSCPGSGYVLSNKKIFLGQNQSVFCWVKLNSFNSSSNLTGICGQHNYHNNVGLGLNLIYASSTSGYVGVSTGTGNARTYQTHIGSTLLSAGQWYHIGYTYNGSQIKIYVNGNLDKTISFSGIITPPDYFQAFQWSLSTNGQSGVQGSYAMNGFLNDVRAYDHVLSTKEIKELAKGLMIYYPFRDPYIGQSENLVGEPVVTGSAANAGWDATLHKDAVTVTNWTVGYNSGVKVPTIGWHAHWKVINNIPTMVFPRLNSRYTADDSTVTASRWLGISSTNNLNTTITSNMKYCISFEAKADTPGREVYCGYHYHNGTSLNFHDGYGYASDIPTEEWKRYSFYWTTDTVTTTSTSRVYIYGMSGADGTAYVRNVSVSLVSTVDECNYTTKEVDSTIYDSSGFGHSIQPVNDAMISGRDESFEYYLNQFTNRPANISTRKYAEGCLRTSQSIHIPTVSTISLYINKKNNGHFIDWRKDSSTGLQPIYFDGTGRIQYWTSTLSNADYFNYTFENNVWYHICLVANSSTVKLYVNGEYHSSKANAAPVATACPLTLFARCSNENIIEGQIGDFRIYSTEFSDADVKKLYQQIAIDTKSNVYSKEYNIKNKSSVINER